MGLKPLAILTNNINEYDAEYAVTVASVYINKKTKWYKRHGCYEML